MCATNLSWGQVVVAVGWTVNSYDDDKPSNKKNEKGSWSAIGQVRFRNSCPATTRCTETWDRIDNFHIGYRADLFTKKRTFKSNTGNHVYGMAWNSEVGSCNSCAPWPKFTWVNYNYFGNTSFAVIRQTPFCYYALINEVARPPWCTIWQFFWNVMDTIIFGLLQLGLQY